jgi:hypothetical protein
VKRAPAALDEVVLDELGNAQKVRIGQLRLVQLTVRVKPAPAAPAYPALVRQSR